MLISCYRPVRRSPYSCAAFLKQSARRYLPFLAFLPDELGRVRHRTEGCTRTLDADSRSSLHRDHPSEAAISRVGLDAANFFQAVRAAAHRGADSASRLRDDVLFAALA